MSRAHRQEATGPAPFGLSRSAASQAEPLVPCAAALNVSAGLYLDPTGHTYPITNWFDANGDECPREDAVTCVAGSGARWFVLPLSDFTEGGARA